MKKYDAVRSITEKCRAEIIIHDLCIMIIYFGPELLEYCWILMIFKKFVELIFFSLAITTFE